MPNRFMSNMSGSNRPVRLGDLRQAKRVEEPRMVDNTRSLPTEGSTRFQDAYDNAREIFSEGDGSRYGRTYAYHAMRSLAPLAEQELSSRGDLEKTEFSEQSALDRAKLSERGASNRALVSEAGGMARTTLAEIGAGKRTRMKIGAEKELQNRRLASLGEQSKAERAFKEKQKKLDRDLTRASEDKRYQYEKTKPIYMNPVYNPMTNEFAYPKNVNVGGWDEEDDAFFNSLK